MAVQYEQAFQTSTLTQLPSTAATTVTYGFNAQAGPIEYLMMVGDLTFADEPTAGSVFQLIDSMRIVVNGEVRFDFRAGFSGNASTLPDCFQTLVNKIGGRCLEDPAGTTTRKFYAAIPLGLGTVGRNDSTRFEIIVGYAATATGGTVSAGSTLEYWMQYNPNFMDGCVVASPTSYLHSQNSIETVQVKIPTNIPGAVVAGIYIQNQTALDEFGNQGVRCVELGSYGIIPEFARFLNGTLGNGLQFAGAAVTDQQEFAADLKGALFLPTFGLTNAGEVTLIVSTGTTVADTTLRTYTPVLTLPSASTQQQTMRQTSPAIGDTAASIVGRTLD